MLSDFEKKLAAFIEKSNLFGPVEDVLLAFSGGADSTVLLYALCKLKEEKIFRNSLVCAHLNHLLRGRESDNDENFAVQQADMLSLPIVTKKINVRLFAKENKLSIETAARQLRIKTLIEIAKANNCSLIATAHQADDNAETIIHRLLRGTGFRGLAGIWPKRNFENNIAFIRPLLSFTRAEVMEYLKQKNLSWRVDGTNQDLTFKRNYIRHLLLPQLQKRYGGSLVKQLFELSQSACKFYSSVYSITEKLLPELTKSGENSLRLDLKIFSTQHPEVKVELLRKTLSCLGSGEKSLNYNHYQRILRLAGEKVSSKQIDLPGCFFVLREYDKLIFMRSQKKGRSRIYSEIPELRIPGIIKWDNFLIESRLVDASSESVKNLKDKKNKFVEHFDFHKLRLPLKIRYRTEGDKFRPLGMPSEKKVGKFLTGAKVPRNIREKMLVVADSEKIIWLWPVRISEQAKVTDKTKKILQLQINDSEK